MNCLAMRIEQLVDRFPNQSIDFFSAVRSRIYDEQIRQFIHKIGLNRISSRLVNSAEEPPKFPKPNFSLSRLVEFGNLMIGEQKRVETMGLAREYNHALRLPAQESVNAKPTGELPQEKRQTNVRNELVNEPTDGKAVNGFNQSGNGKNQVPNTPLDLETQEQIRELLAQGYRLGIEYGNERRVRNNAWQSGTSFQGNEASEAIIALAESLTEHSGEYVRLIGIDPKAKRRVLEKIIQRPHN
jgi:ribulose bisphosphate carboxylase small subunit